MGPSSLDAFVARRTMDCILPRRTNRTLAACYSASNWWRSSRVWHRLALSIISRCNCPQRLPFCLRIVWPRREMHKTDEGCELGIVGEARQTHRPQEVRESIRRHLLAAEEGRHLHPGHVPEGHAAAAHDSSPNAPGPWVWTIRGRVCHSTCAADSADVRC